MRKLIGHDKNIMFWVDSDLKQKAAKLAQGEYRTVSDWLRYQIHTEYEKKYGQKTS